MKLIIVGGPPSVGKSAVLSHALRHLERQGRKVGIVKLDCLVAGDEEVYASKGFETITGLSTYVCPDHYLATNIDRIVAWGMRRGTDLLVIESAGLCNRCSPYVKGSLAVAVMDTLSGVRAPRKMGPLLRSADLVVITRGDLVSQAEREVFRLRVAAVNRRAKLMEVNGLTGQGTRALASELNAARSVDLEEVMELRFPMPSAVCSFCLGEKRIGDRFASGSVRLMSLPDDPAPGAARESRKEGRDG